VRCGVAMAQPAKRAARSGCQVVGSSGPEFSGVVAMQVLHGSRHTMATTPGKAAYAFFLMLFVAAAAGMLGYITYEVHQLMANGTLKVQLPSGAFDPSGSTTARIVQNVARQGLSQAGAAGRALRDTAAAAVGAAVTGAAGAAGAKAGGVHRVASKQELATLKASPGVKAVVAVSPTCPHCVTMGRTLDDMHASGALAGKAPVMLLPREAWSPDVPVNRVPQVFFVGNGVVTPGPAGAMGPAAVQDMLAKMA
jgi:hypothetical protein